MPMKNEDRPVRDDSQSRQANVNYGPPTPLDLYWQRTGYPSKKDSDKERIRKVRGSIPYA